MKLHQQARAIFESALASVAPAPLVARALAGTTPARRVHLLAVGKAAPGMAEGAMQALAGHGLVPAGGLVVAATPAPAIPGLRMVIGNHPLPGARSLAAADALGKAVRAVHPGDEVWVLLSGGATSLLAAPREGLDAASFAEAMRRLLDAGLPIDQLNALRRRLLRWTDGRLSAALAPAAVRCLALSDVPAGRERDIGSGPCSPLPAEERHVENASRLGLPEKALEVIRNRQANAANPPPHVEVEVVGSNATAVEAARNAASGLGLHVMDEVGGLDGEASRAGGETARRLVGSAARLPACLVAGGETVVRLGPDAGTGGRCQELALAAARELSGQPGVVLLAAGTDGRDGPTDAAGAVVDGNTWTAIDRAGHRAEEALRCHDAWPALDAVGALLRTGPTGTNVADLVVGLRALP